jgi:hypothetical protein
MAITYFGHNVEEGGSLGQGHTDELHWNNPATVEYTCPGSGQQLVRALEAYVSAGEAGHVKAIVYTAAGAKVCEAVGAYTSGAGWYGIADDPTAISPANTTLTGGQKYILALILDKYSVWIKGGALANGNAYAADSYASPAATIPGSPTIGNSVICVRCGVEPAPDPAPTITSLDVTSGVVTGGTAVDITGTGFTATPTVTFGGEAATSVVRVSATHVTCVTPAHAAGAVNVVVTNPDNQTATKTNGYTYTAVPAAATVVHGSRRRRVVK